MASATGRAASTVTGKCLMAAARTAASLSCSLVNSSYSKASFTPGSWWPYWAEWLEAKDRAKQVPARHPGADPERLTADEPAPGAFVLAS